MSKEDIKSDYWCATCNDLFTLTKFQRDAHQKLGHDIGDNPLH